MQTLEVEELCQQQKIISEFSIKRRKNTYHTSLVLKYKTGTLTHMERKLIHPNTLRDWDKRDLSKIIGMDNTILRDTEMYKAVMKIELLRKAMKVFYFVLRCYQKVLFSEYLKKRIIRVNQDLFIESIDYLSHFVSKKKACRFFGILPQKLHYWKSKNDCQNSAFKLCIKKYKHQLTFAEQCIVRKFVTAPQHYYLPLNFIWSLMMRSGQAFMGLSTFYKYGNYFIEKYVKLLPLKERERVQVKATRPFQILHMDCTVKRLKDGTRVYIHFIMDNFSKAVLGAKLALSTPSSMAAANLKEVFQKYKLYYKAIDLYCDGGSENKGEVDDFLKLQYVKVKKVVNDPDNYVYNNVIEAFNNRFKNVLLQTREYDTSEQMEKALPEIIEYNNNLYFPLLQHLSPNEVLNGKIPNKNIFKEQIVRARQNRVIENENNPCLPSC